MKWQKYGVVWRPDGSLPWARTHATCPTPLALDDGSSPKDHLYITSASEPQILLGLDRPAADVSRGSSAHDILGVAAIVGLQSIDYDEVYPNAGKKLPGE